MIISLVNLKTCKNTAVGHFLQANYNFKSGPFFLQFQIVKILPLDTFYKQTNHKIAEYFN